MELHKIKEWEEKKPYDVEFRQLKTECGSVLRAVGHENNNGIGKLPKLNKMLLWKEDGKCYEILVVVTVMGDNILRNLTEDELDDMPWGRSTYLYRNENHDIRW